ncbi:hypothetical protein K070079E91_22730 [Eisenbergiella porci]
MHGYLATAARVKYPAALQCCKFVPLLAAGYLIAAKLVIAPGFKAKEQEKEEKHE